MSAEQAYDAVKYAGGLKAVGDFEFACILTPRGVCLLAYDRQRPTHRGDATATWAHIEEMGRTRIDICKAQALGKAEAGESELAKKVKKVKAA